MSRTPCLLIVLLLCAGCTGNDSSFGATGVVDPTVAGSSGGVYPGYQQARDAFTRMSPGGVVQATLEDASWLRFEGDAATVEKNHRAYFDYGYTTFQVVLRVKEYTRPTGETFVLEDSAGARVAGKPVTFAGNMKLVGDRWQFTFNISFQHTITSDTKWVKLSRAADGESVEWRFGAGP